jgi:hypothetical protein
VLQLEDDALARRKPLHRRRDPRLNFLPQKLPLGIERRAVFALPFEEIGDAFLMLRRVGFRRLILRTRLAAAQMIEAHVGDDAVEPGIKAALEAKPVKVAIDLQKGVLVHVPCVFLALHQIQSQSQHVAVVAVN